MVSWQLTLLGEEQTVALLQRDPVSRMCPSVSAILSALPAELRDVPRVLVVWGESGWVGGLCDFCADDLLEGVDSLALVVEGEHEMHAVPR